MLKWQNHEYFIPFQDIPWCCSNIGKKKCFLTINKKLKTSSSCCLVLPIIRSNSWKAKHCRKQANWMFGRSYQIWTSQLSVFVSKLIIIWVEENVKLCFLSSRFRSNQLCDFIWITWNYVFVKFLNQRIWILTRITSPWNKGSRLWTYDVCEYWCLWKLMFVNIDVCVLIFVR